VKVYLKPLMATLCVAGFIGMPIVLAQTSNTQTQSAQLANSAQTHKIHHRHHYVRHSASHRTANASLDGEMVTTTTPPVSQQISAKQLRALIEEQREYLPFDLDVPGQAFVSTGPYVGVPYQFAGNNLVVNAPSVNIDVQLLNIRRKISEQLHLMGGEITKEPYHSHLLLSGLVESQANYFNKGGSPSTTDIDVTSVSLDAFFLGPSDWTLGFVEFNYANDTPAQSVFTSTNQYRVANSRVFVNKAFVTIGDFQLSPFYASVGQYYVPFGTYSSTMISNLFTRALARTKARAFLLGMQQQTKQAFYGAAYIFRGDSHANSVAKVNNGGVNLGFKFETDYFRGNFGGGVLANLADSGGMQLGNGFATNATTEQLVRRVPTYNLRGMLNVGQRIDLIAEYVGASKDFNAFDMSYNGHGAKPWATDFEVDYTFTFQERPTAVGVSYQKSNEALSLGIPLIRYSLVFNTSIWRNTLQAIEFRCDREYAASDRANGAGGIASKPETGKIDKAVTAQFDYYF
jgi:hypothetical protein